MSRTSIPAAVGFPAAVAGAAVLGSRFTPTGRIGVWYAALRKPPFNPPSSVFPIVWTCLYALMAWSAFRVWRAPAGPVRTRALGAWWAQLGFNAAWSPIFFGARRPWAALTDLAALFVALLLYTIFSRKSDRAAAWMMLPYLAWVAFAGALNFEIARLND